MVVTELVFLACVVIIFNKFENKMKYYVKILLHFVLGWGVLFIIKSSFYVSGLQIMSWSYPLFLFIYSLLVGNRTINYRLFYALNFFVLLFFSTSFFKAVGACICRIADKEYMPEFANMMLVIGRCLLYAGYVVIVFLFPVEKHNNIKHSDYIIVSILSVLVILANQIVDDIKDSFNGILNMTETKYSLFIFVIGLILYVFAFYSYYSCYNRMRKRKAEEFKTGEMAELKDWYSTQRNVYELVQDNLEELRRIRHDVKNQFGYMQAILEQGKYDDLKKYFNELNGAVALPLSFSDCENRIIRDILNLEMSKLKKFEGRIDYKVAVGDNINISEVDLASLLINLLDNAIESIEREKITESEVFFRFLQKESYLYITVKNPVIDTASLDMMKVNKGTHKSDNKRHGLGKTIIESIVKKYKGAVNYTIENNEFVAELMLAVE